MLFALALLAQSNGLNVSTVTGGIIASECAKSQGTQLDTCGSYILGVADTLQFDRKTCHGQSDAWTLQTLAIVRRFIDQHPERWGEHPAYLIRDALMKTFPCPWTKYQKP